MATAYATARFCLFLTFLNMISLGLASDPGKAHARPLPPQRAAIPRCGSGSGSGGYRAVSKHGYGAYCDYTVELE
ncbi:MAG: hypothetical protein ACRED2_06470, partial [Methylocella sp.]